MKGFILLLSYLFLAFSAVPASAKDIVLSEEAGKCLGCHGKTGIVKQFQNSDVVEAYIDAEKFKNSAHGRSDCSSCHADFSGKNHPTRAFRSKNQYKIRSSLECRRCHHDKQLKAKFIHFELLKEEKKGTAMVCADCHSPHSITPVKGGMVLAHEKHYCLNCHTEALTMTFRDGEKMTMAVNTELLLDSVHHDLSCSDCHFGFSSKEHPERNFRTRRDFVITNSEGCRRCHFDKYTKTMESVHFAALSQGNLKAPVCTDCHGSHSIKAGQGEKIQIVEKCRKCHTDIFTVYAASVHGKALIDERNRDVPVCIDCHRTHDIKSAQTLEYREKIPEMCGNCHANKGVVGKYGLSTDVVKSYLSDFHGVTLGFYSREKDKLYKPGRAIAVCTDCHGIHNIGRTVGPNAAIMKANLVRRCQKCHKDADSNFPGTWLSHYEPDLRKAPLVFIVNLIYKFFLPVMVIGLALQILLHIWRYAINR